MDATGRVTAHRHIVIGTGGTVLAAPSAIAIVDAQPDAAEVRTWEALVFGSDVCKPDFDLVAALGTRRAKPFALARSTEHGVTITVMMSDGSGDSGESAARVVVEIDGEVWTPDAIAPAAPCSIDVTADSSIVLSLRPDDDSARLPSEPPSGQWLTIGVVAAEAVQLGALRSAAQQVDRAAAPTRHLPRIDTAVATERAQDADFGSLVASAKLPVSTATPVPASTPDPIPDPTLLPPPDPARTPTIEPPAAAEISDATAPIAPQPGFDPDGVLRISDGQTAPIDAPLRFGRRPPTDLIGDQRPRVVISDDTLLSRHHATMMVVDGRLVIVDEGSANGTTVTLPDGTTLPCPAQQPVEVPLGATVDLGGVISATYLAGEAQAGIRAQGPNVQGSAPC